jgi:hypothetical protein
MVVLAVVVEEVFLLIQLEELVYQALLAKGMMAALAAIIAPSAMPVAVVVRALMEITALRAKQEMAAMA